MISRNPSGASNIEQRVVDFLKQIIAINSVTPAQEETAGGEEGVAALIEERSRRAGLEVSRQTVHPGRDSSPHVQ